jgi:hypothetical protein
MDPLCMSLIMPAYVLCFDKLVADVFCWFLFPELHLSNMLDCLLGAGNKRLNQLTKYLE